MVPQTAAPMTAMPGVMQTMQMPQVSQATCAHADFIDFSRDVHRCLIDFGCHSWNCLHMFGLLVDVFRDVAITQKIARRVRESNDMEGCDGHKSLTNRS